MYKRWMAALVCIGMLCVALAAQAAPGDVVLFERPVQDDGSVEYEYINDVVRVGDTLYILGNSLFSYREGDEAPTVLMDSQAIWGHPMMVMDDGEDGDAQLPEGGEAGEGQPLVAVQIVLDDAEMADGEENLMPDAPEGPHYRPGALVGGGDVLHAVDVESGMLGRWDGQAFQWDTQLDWEDMVEDNGEWTQTREFIFCTMTDGALVALVGKGEDRWGEYDLARFDLATGKRTMLPAQDLVCLAAYRPGKLAALCVNRNDGWRMSIVQVDTASGTVDAPLYDAPENSYLQGGGLAYDAALDALYFATMGTLVKVENNALSEPVAYIASSSIYEGNKAHVLPSGHYAVQTYEGIFVRNLDPQYKPSRVLRVAGGYMTDAMIGFAREHPEIAVQLVNDDAWQTQDIIDTMLTGEPIVDVLSVDASGGLAELLEKGYLAELSESPVLMDEVTGMYPWLQEVLMADGRLYAFPRDAWCSFWAIDLDGMGKVGLEIPQTMSEFLDIVARWVDEDMGEDYPQYMLMNEWMMDGQQLFYQIFEQYIIAYDQDGPPAKLDTPLLRDALEQVKSLPSFGEDEDGMMGGTRVVYYSDREYAVPLIQTGMSPFDGGHWGAPEGYAPQLMLAPPFEPNGPQRSRLQLYVFVVNPRSQNQDLAIQLLEYMAAHQEARTRYLLRPDLNEPIPNAWAMTWIKDATEWVAECETMLAEAAPEDVRDAQERLVEARRSLANAESQRWEVSAEAIAAYRALADDISARLYSPMFNYSNASIEEFWTLLNRYQEGQMQLPDMLREMDRKMQMMYLESM